MEVDEHCCDRADDCPLNSSGLRGVSHCFPVNVAVECINWWECGLTAKDFEVIEKAIKQEAQCTNENQD